jgi:hypothetical protein
MTWSLSMRSRPAKSVAAIPLLASGQERPLGALNLIDLRTIIPLAVRSWRNRSAAPGGFQGLKASSAAALR